MPTEPPRDPIVDLREKWRPQPGESCWYDTIEVRGLPSQRPGLPTLYSVHEHGRLLNHGGWAAVEQFLKRCFKADLSELPVAELCETVPEGQRANAAGEVSGWLARFKHT